MKPFPTTNLTFKGGCLLPPKVTFGGVFGFGDGLYKIASNNTYSKFIYFQGHFRTRSKPPLKVTFGGKTYSKGFVSAIIVLFLSKM